MSEKKREEFNEEQKMIADDLDKASALESLASSEGGKTLVAGLIEDVVGCVDTLCVKYSSLTSQEFVSLCADMKSKLDLARAISRSKGNKEYLQELLEKALAE